MVVFCFRRVSRAIPDIVDHRDVMGVVYDRGIVPFIPSGLGERSLS